MIEFFKQNFALLTLIGAALAVCTGVVWAIVYYLTYAVRSQVLGRTIWSGNAENNSVALTFDDGPAPDTLEILDILREEKVQATFFMIGKQVEKYPEIAKRIADENHEIGNHSYSHPIYLFCRSSKTKLELERTQEIIRKATGIAPKLSRPPCGVRSRAYFAAAEELNLQTVQWSDTGFDWKKFTAERIARNVLETVQSNSIVLLHDGDNSGKSNRQATVKALRIILHGLKEKGLRVVPLARMCPDVYESQSSSNLLLAQSKEKNTDESR